MIFWHFLKKQKQKQKQNKTNKQKQQQKQNKQNKTIFSKIRYQKYFYDSFPFQKYILLYI